MMGEKQFFIYILASRKYGTLYIGVTSDLPGRIYVHREDFLDGFSARYRVHRLVYFEAHGSAYEAIKREKQLKKWRRAWKIDLIEKDNPGWNDLFETIAS